MSDQPTEEDIVLEGYGKIIMAMPMASRKRLDAEICKITGIIREHFARTATPMTAADPLRALDELEKMVFNSVPVSDDPQPVSAHVYIATIRAALTASQPVFEQCCGRDPDLVGEGDGHSWSMECRICGLITRANGAQDAIRVWNNHRRRARQAPAFDDPLYTTPQPNPWYDVAVKLAGVLTEQSDFQLESEAAARTEALAAFTALQSATKAGDQT